MLSPHLLAFAAASALLLVADAPSPSAPQRPTEPADPATYLKGLTKAMREKWPKNRTIHIVCHGHSVPAGYFKTPVVDTFNAYPHLLHRALKQRFPHAVLNVIVTAIGGENSTSGAGRFADDVLALRPDLITIDYGLNDRRIGLPKARENLTAMVRAAQDREIPVLLLTPTGDHRAAWTPEDPLAQQTEMIRALAGQLGAGLVDSYAAFAGHVDGGGELGDLMSQVNHPNRAGHDLVVEALLRWFK